MNSRRSAASIFATKLLTITVFNCALYPVSSGCARVPYAMLRRVHRGTMRGVDLARHPLLERQHHYRRLELCREVIGLQRPLGNWRAGTSCHSSVSLLCKTANHEKSTISPADLLFCFLL